METKNMSNEYLESHVISLIKSERLIEAEILESLLEIKNRRLHKIQKFKNLASYCEKRLGLTYDQAWLRSQATKIISLAPEALELLKLGSTSVSCLALASSKATEANKDKILTFLPSRTKAELSLLLQTIDKDGNSVAIDPTVLLQLRLSIRAMKKFERLQGLLIQSQSPNNKEEVVESALDALLDKLDPIRKEQRRENRRTKLAHKKNDGENPPKKKKEPSKVTRRYVPEAVKAHVLKRDGYQCVELDAYGERCSEKAILQIDHQKPWAIGGGHDPQNLVTLCKAHNLQRAEAYFGEQYIKDKIESGMMPRPMLGEATQGMNGNMVLPRATSPGQMH